MLLVIETGIQHTGKKAADLHMDRIIILIPVVKNEPPREGLVVVADVALAVVPQPAAGKVMAVPVTEPDSQGPRPWGGIYHLRRLWPGRRWGHRRRDWCVSSRCGYRLLVGPL